MCSFQGTSSTSVLPHLLGSLKINQKIFKEPGSHLLSHAVSSIVPSAAQVLTIVFGMGTGVAPERIATEILCYSVISSVMLIHSILDNSTVKQPLLALLERR